jgi:HAD superfamily hydrolase (TIGR01490 family)
MAETEKRPFAVFDIDGTVLRWQLFHAVVDMLGKQGRLPSNLYEEVLAARRDWKHRKTEEAFGEYEMIAVQTFVKMLTKISVSHMNAAAREVFDEYKDQVYRYTRGLIQTLKQQNYLLFAISGSDKKIVKMFTDYHGFDDAIGTTHFVRGSGFTGQIDVVKSERKAELLKELAAKHGATFAGSIAVGDSEGDIQLLGMVEKPIAFNPSKKLFQHAQSHGWKVVVERKNVIYELEPKGSRYVLAKTNAE